MTSPIPALGADKATDERALFEEFLREDPQAEEAGNLVRKGDGYENIISLFQWIAWQARASLAAVPASEPHPAIGDTGNEEADRIISRLMSSDPEFDDCADAASFIRRIVIEHKGPDGFGTWEDAAIAERVRRVKSEKKLAEQPALLQYRYKDVHPQTVTTGQYSEWETCDRAKYDEIVYLRDNDYPHYEVRELYAAAPAPVSGMPDLASLRRQSLTEDGMMEDNPHGNFVHINDVERLLNPTGETK